MTAQVYTGYNAQLTSSTVLITTTNEQNTEYCNTEQCVQLIGWFVFNGTFSTNRLYCALTV